MKPTIITRDVIIVGTIIAIVASLWIIIYVAHKLEKNIDKKLESWGPGYSFLNPPDTWKQMKEALHWTGIGRHKADLNEDQVMKLVVYSFYTIGLALFLFGFYSVHLYYLNSRNNQFRELYSKGTFS